MMLSTPSLIRLPVLRSMRTYDVFGACFTKTTMVMNVPLDLAVEPKKALGRVLCQADGGGNLPERQCIRMMTMYGAQSFF